MSGLVENLRRRAEIVRGLRAYFDARDFVEVETPVRLAAPAPEPHIDCPVAAPDATVAPGVPTYLRASPELQMKKLLAAGMERIYQIGPCFREGERGSRHAPEFTMIEWYRRGATYLDIAADLEGLLRQLSNRRIVESSNDVSACAERFDNSTIPQFENFPRLTVREAYRRWAGWDPWTDWNQDRFDFDMAEKVEPSLPSGPVFLTDYPPQAASLARLRGDVAERWEFYLDGLELANCFTELRDGAEQRRRFEAAREERRRLGESDYALDGEFLDALPLVGSAAGVALGVDRLVMRLCGAPSVASVRCGV